MRNETQLSINVNSADKRAANKLFRSMGLNMSTAVNMFLKQVITRKAIPFKIEAPRYDEIDRRVDNVVKDHKFKKHIING